MRKEHARLQEKQQLRGRRAVYIPTHRKKRDGWGTRCFGVGWERDRGNGNGSGKSNDKGNGSGKSNDKGNGKPTLHDKTVKDGPPGLL